MGSPLGPTLANIIMTEFEELIIKPLIDSNKIKFYKRYVDDTLILAKPSDIEHILKQFNSFHTNIQFTVDDFPDNDIHFLDIQIHPTGTTVYRKYNLLLGNILTTPASRHGQERLLGSERLLTVHIRSAAMMNF